MMTGWPNSGPVDVDLPCPPREWSPAGGSAGKRQGPFVETHYALENGSDQLRRRDSIKPASPSYHLSPHSRRNKQQLRFGGWRLLVVIIPFRFGCNVLCWGAGAGCWLCGFAICRLPRPLALAHASAFSPSLLPLVFDGDDAICHLDESSDSNSSYKLALWGLLCTLPRFKRGGRFGMGGRFGGTDTNEGRRNQGAKGGDRTPTAGQRSPGTSMG
jgi:hypothetical protein